MAATYCTVADVRSYSNNADFTEGGEGAYVMTDEQVTAKIEAAETYIDAWAGYWPRAGGYTQALVFPRAGFNETTPNAIKLATVAQVEFMHENAPDIEHGITADKMEMRISPRAKELMRGYTKRTGTIQLDETVDPRML